LPDKVMVGDVTLSHGSPRNPVWEYLLDTYVAGANLLILIPNCVSSVIRIYPSGILQSTVLKMLNGRCFKEMSPFILNGGQS
jgi:hypothetical protein